MLTTIRGFHRDTAGDWVAELACDHNQHMRHNPPWLVREWVTSEAGRGSKLGAEIDCPLCDAIAMPPDAREYKRTSTFTADTLPEPLRGSHRTKTGTWGRIVVESGALEYHVRGRVHRLAAGDVGLVEPEVPHHVVPLAEARLYIEFWRVG
jgi:tellurite resistance-related uncharacterized protein